MEGGGGGGAAERVTIYNSAFDILNILILYCVRPKVVSAISGMPGCAYCVIEQALGGYLGRMLDGLKANASASYPDPLNPKPLNPTYTLQNP